jgi:hypothetical protein
MPLFHLFVVPVLVLNLVWQARPLVAAPSLATAAPALVAAALVGLAFAARIFALTVQDRLIRLEMRLRLQQVLPLGLHPRIPEFTINQLVAMRFASDGELPELAQRVLLDRIDNRKTIKKMIRQWEADHQRV